MGKRNSFISRTPLLIYTEYKPFQSIFDFYYVHLSAHTRKKNRPKGILKAGSADACQRRGINGILRIGGLWIRH